MRTEGRTYIKKLIVAFCNFAKAPKNTVCGGDIWIRCFSEHEVEMQHWATAVIDFDRFIIQYSYVRTFYTTGLKYLILGHQLWMTAVVKSLL
jgi:hypothetical protein